MSWKISIGQLELRQFGIEDARELYCIRNHESVRRFMARPELIPYPSHLAWVKQHLVGAGGLVLLLVRKKPSRRAVGFTQLRVEGEVGEIGVMFREPERHRIAAAVATAATLHLGFCWLGLSEVVSYVVPSYEAAAQFNRAWGGVDVPSDRAGLIKLALARERCLSNPNYLRVMGRVIGEMRIES